MEHPVGREKDLDAQFDKPKHILQDVFVKMLDHIEHHKEAYDKPQWTNDAIVRIWIKTCETELDEILIKQ